METEETTGANMETEPRLTASQKAGSAAITVLILTVSAIAICSLWVLARLPAMIISLFILFGGTKFLPKTPRWQSIGEALMYGTFLGTALSFGVQFLFMDL
jgi:hypothetical protein